jgi:hypothetical protein
MLTLRAAPIVCDESYKRVLIAGGPDLCRDMRMVEHDTMVSVADWRAPTWVAASLSTGVDDGGLLDGSGGPISWLTLTYCLSNALLVWL